MRLQLTRVACGDKWPINYISIQSGSFEVAIT